MESNLKVRTYENSSIYGQHRKRALGFEYRLSPNWRDELFVLPFPADAVDPGISMQGGNGHIRMSLKGCFRKHLGTETPTFAQVYEYYSQHADEHLKAKGRKNCCG